MSIKNFFKKKKPETLAEFKKAGLITEEEFLRLIIIRKQSDLDKAKKKLLNFLKKKKK